MTQVGLLTEEQKNLLVGLEFIPDVFLNPIQDNNNNWIISVEAINQCVNEKFMWIKELELITYEPKIQVNEK